ncbi:hypothetical protein ACS0TY_025052 [Phlomoides rotata]
MAISSSTFPKKINRYKLSTLSVLLVFIFCIFLFNKRALDRKLFQNTDPIPQTPASILLSPPRSTKFLEKLGDLRDPVASLSNVASSSELSEPESQEEGKEEHVSSESDFDDKTTRENNVPFVSTDSESGDKLGDRNGEPKSPNEEKVSSLLSEPEFQEKSKEERVSLTTNLDEKTTQDIEKPNIASDPESQDNLGERNGEPMSSNEEKVVPISSESDTNDKTREKSEYIGVKEKSQDDFGERTDDPTSSNEETSVPISSNSDVDDNTEEKSEDIGLEETPSSDAEIGGVIDNAFVEKLRNCDIYKGTWVKDDDYPLYKPGSCPYVDDGFSCQSNGRPDSGYTQWRWKPDECDLPSKNYYKEGDHIYPRFDAAEAYRRAITTWATWVKKNMQRKKLVIYRGYSSAHFRGGDWDSGGSCNGETEPVVKGAILDSYPQKMTIVEEVIRETQVPVVLLNVTRLTNFRKDGHPSIYGKNVTRLKKVSTRRQDCSHWCLPGVPDSWNELIYATLIAKQT